VAVQESRHFRRDEQAVAGDLGVARRAGAR
jgi:hypothetical protein